MWFLIVALISIVASLALGRLLARARFEQTNPYPLRGPSVAVQYPSSRDVIAENAWRRRLAGLEVHLN